MRNLLSTELGVVSGGDNDFAWAPYAGAGIGAAFGFGVGCFTLSIVGCLDAGLAIGCLNPSAAAGCLLIACCAPLPITATTLGGALVGSLVGAFVMLSQE